MEENLISEIDSTYQVYLKGNETIHIPFKLQCFTTDVETPEIVSSFLLSMQYVSYLLSHIVFEETDVKLPKLGELV